MTRKITTDTIEGLLTARDIRDLDYESVLSCVLDDETISPWRPEGVCRVDPRNGERTVYSPVRAARPHDNRPETALRDEALPEKPCPVCSGNTTSIIDVARLSEGVTFINKNLFPILYPEEGAPWPEVGTEEAVFDDDSDKLFRTAAGMHFLQWTSSFHDRDIHNMSIDDVRIVIDRLALLEEKLLHGGGRYMPSTARYEKAGHFGYVGIIKNYGYLVGGSLTHGHQQIVHTNIMPRKTLQDLAFLERHGRSFSDYLARVNPEGLDLWRFGPVRALVPYFMKRPLDTIILFEGEGADANYLHHLDDRQRAGLAAALRATLASVLKAMPAIGREPTFNMVVHNGPIGGLYVEIHPYTQETGGYEHLGLWLCQGSPSTSRDLMVDTWKSISGE